MDDLIRGTWVADYYQEVIRICAKKLGIENSEWFPSNELLGLIKLKFADVYNKYKEFIEAYSEWFVKTNGNIDSQSHSQLVANRDKKRQDLIDTLNKKSQ